jgi:hypothetical protein
MWLDGIAFKEKILSVFRHPPSIDEVFLHELKLHQDGPHLTLRFNLKDYPDAPPLEWVEKGYNTVQVTLELWGLHSIEIRGFSTENVVKIQLTPSNRYLEFLITGTTNISGSATNGMIQKVSAYRKEMQ